MPGESGTFGESCEGSISSISSARSELHKALPQPHVFYILPAVTSISKILDLLAKIWGSVHASGVASWSKVLSCDTNIATQFILSLLRHQVILHLSKCKWPSWRSPALNWQWLFRSFKRTDADDEPKMACHRQSATALQELAHTDGFANDASWWRHIEARFGLRCLLLRLEDARGRQG